MSEVPISNWMFPELLELTQTCRTSYLSLLACHRGASWVHYSLASIIMTSLRFPKIVPHNVMLITPNFSRPFNSRIKTRRWPGQIGVISHIWQQANDCQWWNWNPLKLQETLVWYWTLNKCKIYRAYWLYCVFMYCVTIQEYTYGVYLAFFPQIPLGPV